MLWVILTLDASRQECGDEAGLETLCKGLVPCSVCRISPAD